jgi:hypothetical protein
LESLTVVDTTMPSRPLRSLVLLAREPAVLIESLCRQPRLVERIDLLAAGANERLARYTLA